MSNKRNPMFRLGQLCFWLAVMAGLSLQEKMHLVLVLIVHLKMMQSLYHILLFILLWELRSKTRSRVRDRTYCHQTLRGQQIRSMNLQKIVFESDRQSIENCRMDRRSFRKLCYLLKTDGHLEDNRNMSVEEMVTSFLHILAHHTKNRIIKRQTARSGETISRQFHAVLTAVLRLHPLLFKKPEPIQEDCTDSRWSWFKGCLGALDGTHIKVNVPIVDKPRYRSRKGDIVTNVLGVCTPSMQFIYVLPGWEGSAADGRVLRDAIGRPNGLRIPQGCYYLCDAGYTNGEGFLAPYRGQRYHLNEWRHGHQPRTPQEYFNMKHSQARNCIERCFGILKARWAIIREKSFYPVRTQCRIISACCLLHNFIRAEMETDPIEDVVVQDDSTQQSEDDGDEAFITHCETSDAWTEFRNKLANDMFNAWKAGQSASV
ncbi:hypothetical protein PTKIN_Ptkin06aG0109000 [Pterospermum kingtungense]